MHTGRVLFAVAMIVKIPDSLQSPSAGESESMLAKLNTLSLLGIEAPLVEVEVDVSGAPLAQNDVGGTT